NARGDGDQHDAGQEVVHIVGSPGADGAPKDVDEQQHQSDRCDRCGDDSVHAPEDVPHGTASQYRGIHHEMRAHDPSFTDSLRPTSARKMSSRLGCFSTYSTVAGGRSRLSSANVPLAMIRPACRMA